MLFLGTVQCLPWNDYHPKVTPPPISKPISSYFVEIDTIITRLATWTPSDKSSDFPGAEKDLFQLGQSIDQATQALKAFNGTIDYQNLIKIDTTLKSSSKNVVKITKNVKAAKEVFVKYNYTTLIVQVLQASANQFSVLFPLLESHSPPASFASLGYSISLIICSIGDSIEYLQPHSCTPEGLKFCKSLKHSKAGSIDTKPACQVVKPSDSFSQCNNSSTTMFKYGYENSCIGKPQTGAWCDKGTKTGSESGQEGQSSSSSTVSQSSSKSSSYVPGSSNGAESYSFSSHFEVDINIVFGYTPAQSQLYTVCNPPK